ncbi:MAG: hypothetical protein H0X33_03455 [Taibaiella sp.]|nr:hypothetical protein [Taibaiella sp.]
MHKRYVLPFLALLLIVVGVEFYQKAKHSVSQTTIASNQPPADVDLMHVSSFLGGLVYTQTHVHGQVKTVTSSILWGLCNRTEMSDLPAGKIEE